MIDFIRKYLGVFIISITLTIFFGVILGVRGTQMASNLSNFDRYDDSEILDIVYANEKDEKNSFVNLSNAGFLLTDENIRLDSDVYMLDDEVKYEENLFLYDNRKLNKDECLISLNVLKEYNLDIGDKVHLQDKSNIKIVGALPAQTGIDEKGYHDGITIIGCDEDYINLKPRKYLIFYSDSDVYTNIIKRANCLEIRKDLKDIVMDDLGLMLPLIILIPLITDLLSDFYRYKYYRYYLKLGERKYKVILKAFKDNMFKYLIPNLIACLIFVLINTMYIHQALVLGLIYFINSLVITLIITFINIWRAIGWKMKV